MAREATFRLLLNRSRGHHSLDNLNIRSFFTTHNSNQRCIHCRENKASVLTYTGQLTKNEIRDVSTAHSYLYCGDTALNVTSQCCSDAKRPRSTGQSLVAVTISEQTKPRSDLLFLLRRRDRSDRWTVHRVEMFYLRDGALVRRVQHFFELLSFALCSDQLRL